MRGRRFWFFRLAAATRLPPIAIAALAALLISALSPAVEHLAGPIDYTRKPFESRVPHMMAVNLMLFVAFLQLAERWAARAVNGLRPFVDELIDPELHPSLATWGGAAVCLPVVLLTHEINTSRWSRLVACDWNLFDAWAVIVVLGVLTLCYQVVAAVYLLAWRVGRIATNDFCLDLFDPSRGRPLAGLALRLALVVALTGVTLAVLGLVGAWAFWPSLFFGTINLASCVLLVSLCIRPFVRAMRSLKETELARVHRAIGGDPNALTESPLAGRLEGLDFVGLLAYRREVMEASVWPLDAAQSGRLVLYLVLPPLSWVAAAFVEQWVQRGIAG